MSRDQPTRPVPAQTNPAPGTLSDDDFQRQAQDALSAHRAGRYHEAIAHYQSLLAHRPALAALHSNLGEALLALGRIDEAADSCRRAVAIAPSAPAFTLLGAALFAQGHAEEAIDACGDALRLDPRQLAARLTLAAALFGAGRLTEADQACRQAIAQAPTAKAFLLLGRIATAAGDGNGALDAARRAAAADPNSVDAAMALGAALNDRHLYAEAETAFRHVIGLKPDSALAYSNLGSVLIELGRETEALDLCRRAVALDPGLAAAHGNLGLAAFTSRQWETATAAFRQSLRLDPSDAGIHINYGTCLQNGGWVRDAADQYREALTLAPSSPNALRSLLLNAAYRDDLDIAAFNRIHREAGAAFARPAVIAPLSVDADPERRLRIGYVSSDFRSHPVAGNMLPFWRHRDREGFSQIFYADVAQPDATTDEIRGLADGWHDIRGLDAAAVADLVRADRIDILVLLAGRFDRNRPDLACHRAAPIQISLHDVGTSGLAEMDYIVGDRWLLPKGGPEYFSERILRLPQFYVADWPRDLPDLSEGRWTGPVVFGSFNAPAKIGDRVLACWGRILAALPESRLVLKHTDSFNREDLRDRVRTAITGAGASADQIVFVTAKESGRVFLSRYNGIDVALDPFPFSGATTSFTALAMGVPVVTRPMDRMVSRWTGAMLSRLGLGELIARSDDDYVETAIRVGSNVDSWRSRRGDIRARLAASPMVRGAHWARHLERLYRAVWRRHCRTVAAPRPAPAAADTDREIAALAARAARLFETGHPDEAVAVLDRALLLAPGWAGGHCDRGVLLMAAGRPTEAVTAYRRAIALDSTLAMAHSNLAAALLDGGEPAAAIEAARAALALAPDLADAHYNLAGGLADLARYEEAVEAYRRALALAPAHRDAAFNLGLALNSLKRWDEAASVLEALIRRHPDHTGAQQALGAALSGLKRHEEAQAIYRRMIALSPTHIPAYTDLAVALMVTRRFDEAADVCRRALEIDPDSVMARCGLADALARRNQFADSMAESERALDLDPGNKTAYQLLFGAALYREDLSAEALVDLHRRRSVPFPRPDATPAATDPDPERRLRIGFVSADFHGHPVAGNLMPVLAHHDRDRFALYFYADVDEPDAVTGEFKALAEGWRDIRGLDDEGVAAKIRADRIDILVLLAGRFEGNRPTLSLYRAAPVQISMHDGGTSGFREMDYFIADPWLVPFDTNEFFVERVLRLPLFYIRDLPPELPDIADRGDGPPVFGSFHNPAKLNSRVLALWGRILAALPESRLVLKYEGQFGDEAVRRRVLAGLAAGGAAPGQVTMPQGGREAGGAFLARHNDVDLALDPFPFSGSTASFMALAMGVPVVTRPADGLASRMTATILHAVGLDELVARSDEDYVDIVLGIAGDIGRWRSRRRDIRDRIKSSSLVDGGRWARWIERLYRAVWRRYCRRAALTPADIARLAADAMESDKAGRLTETVRLLHQLIAAKPDFAEAHSNLGSVFKRLGHNRRTAVEFRRTVALKPDDATAWSNLGSALIDSYAYAEAETACRRAIALDPRLVDAHVNLSVVVFLLGRVAETMAIHETLLGLCPNHVGIARTRLLAAMYRDDLDTRALADLHRDYGRMFDVAVVAEPPADSDPERRLRVGLLSSDFHHHPVAYNLLPALAHRDRRTLELFVYADDDAPDKTTDRVRAEADHWRDVGRRTDADIAAAIRADHIDILVILAGRFDQNRPNVACHRAAPVQISMHDVATSGLREMDYIIGDSALIPRHTPEWFSERPLRLPCFHLHDMPGDLPAIAMTRAPGPPVFGCFNNPKKISPATLRLWGRILAADPGSRLMLHYVGSYRAPDLRRRIIADLVAAGARARQVEFGFTDEPGPVFLDRYNRIDVALDPFPFSGSTTTFQALSMGVPVVTLPLDRMVSRWSLSILRAIGLEEWAASSEEAYVDTALRLARDAESWRARRPEIRARLAASAVTDGAGYARHLERLFRATWRRACRGNRPEPADPDRLAREAMDHQRAGRLDQAVATLERLLAVRPDLAAARANLGVALKDLGRLDEAVTAFTEAARRTPDDPVILSNLGAALLDRSDYAGARAALTRAIDLKPDLAEAHGNLGALLARLGEHAGAMACYDKALALHPDDIAIRKKRMASALYRGDYDDAALNAVLAEAADALPGPTGLARPSTDPDPDRRLRIGLVSSDFHEHPLARNLLPGLEHHDTGRVALCFYSDVARPDAVTARFRALAEIWRDVGRLDDAALAERIRADKIDILVILAGRFDRNRPALARHRAAPIQISMHDVATSGLAETDYIIGDPRLLPRRTAEWFSERPLRLSHFYLAAPPANLPALAETRNGPPVFGCFNNPGKITDRVLAMWGRILAALPASRLVLGYLDAYGAPEQRDRILAGLGAQGAALGERIVFQTLYQPDSAFLERYNGIDVALDTFPFSGSTTTFQALSMGVPVVTRPLDRMVSRWSAALLAPLGLEALIADSDDSYVDIAVAAARDVESWRGRRRDIRARLIASPFCDQRRWARQMERLYRAVWRRHCRMETGPGPSLIAPTGEDEIAARRLQAEAGAAWGRGDHAEAVALLRRALALNPDDARGRCDLGSMLKARGEREEAIAAYRKAIALDPGLAMAHSNLGVALQEAGRLDEAVDAYARAIATDPGFASARSNLAVALLALDRTEESIAACRDAIAAIPGLAEAHYNLGLALDRAGDGAGAVAAWTQATLLKPDYPAAFIQLAFGLKARDRLKDAVAAARQAVALAPDLAETQTTLGRMLVADERFDDAVEPFRRTLELAPGNAEAYTDLGVALDGAKRYDEARTVYEHALGRGLETAAIHSNLGIVYWRLGRSRDAFDQMELAVRLEPDNPLHARLQLLTAIYLEDIDSDAFADLHRRFGRTFGGKATGRPATDPDPERRIRIGFLSSDLARHPVASNLLPVLPHYDRDRVSLHFYAQRTKEDGFTAAIRAQADGWRIVSGLDDETVARQIRADKIDILVIMGGRFDDNRPTVACWRAAPIQISLHDGATSGLDDMDYIIGDPWLTPRGTTEYFSERPLRLPYFYVADLPSGLPEPVDRRGDGPPVFGCFNNPAKIGPRLLGLWGRILAALPDSRLILKYQDAYNSTDHRTRFLDALVGGGAAPDQVVFIGRKDSFADFMARYNAIDVALDTFPFSGSTTTFQALVMGTPVVTRPTNRMISRWSASMLHALDMTELIADSDESYVDIAVRTARDAARWWARRPAIRARLTASPLCDGARWARQSERLFRAVWRRYCHGAPAMPPATADAPAETPAEAPLAPVAAPKMSKTDELTAKAAGLHRAGRLDEAERLYREALALDPDEPVVLHYLGVLLHDRGDSAHAVELLERAVALAPKWPEFHANLGMVLRKLGRTDEAAESYRRSLALQPDNAVTHYNLGNLLAAEGRLDEALTAYRRAVDLAPHIPECQNGLGATLRRLGRTDEAIAALTEALRQRPAFAEAQNNLGACFYDLRDLDRARACYAEAIRINPDYAEARKNLGAALYEQGDTDGAIAQYRGAIAIAPAYADAHFHLGCALLRRGDFPQGWAEYEWRREMPAFPAQTWPVPEWRGEPLAGRRLLLYGEQGYGDIIQFARFAPVLAEAGAHVILCVAPALMRLMRTLSGVGEIVEVNRPLPPFDFHIPLLSVPHRLGLTLDTIPAVPYLRAEPDAAARWRKRLAARPGLKVGLVWAGNPRRDDRDNWLVDRRRSLSLAAFAPLAGTAGITLVSLQKGEPAAEAGHPPPGLDLFDPMAEIGDFADTAALISALDLVIGVDTSVIHLAGALGVPVWVLSRYDGCWRWLEKGERSPWYPSLRLFRQETPGDWTETIARLAGALAEFGRDRP